MRIVPLQQKHSFLGILNVSNFPKVFCYEETATKYVKINYICDVFVCKADKVKVKQINVTFFDVHSEYI